MGSALLHLQGAAVGLVLGTVMLKMNWVDCEGWDFFSKSLGKSIHETKKKKKNTKKASFKVRDIGDVKKKSTKKVAKAKSWDME
jgi:L-lactate permease